MIPSEPLALTWVFLRALDKAAEFPADASWRSGLSALQASRLTSLAAHLVLPHAAEFPADLRLHFDAARLMGESLARQRREQVAEAGEMMNRAGISWLVFKGWPMAARLYTSPALRPSGDLDLLVSPEDLRTAIAACESEGYQVLGDDQSYHVRLVRETKGQGLSVIELHHRAGPPQLAGPATGELLAERVRFESSAGEVWVPSRDHEVDLLVRHYLRHAGYQAILLLDILKLLGDGRFAHPVGSLIGDDLSRLGLERTVDGPVRWSHWALGRWMRSRTFEQRRSERHAALVGIPLALGNSLAGKAAALGRVVWPRNPTPRWLHASQTPAGRLTWRLRRAVRFGK